MAEQRYKAVMAVVSEGRTITQAARDWGVSRQTMHAWLARYEADGLEGLANISHRPAHCPHQMAAAVEVQLLEMRRAKPYWGARRLALELTRKGVQPAPSKSAVYRSLVALRKSSNPLEHDQVAPVPTLRQIATRLQLCEVAT